MKRTSAVILACVLSFVLQTGTTAAAASLEFEALLSHLQSSAAASDPRYSDCQAILSKQSGGKQHLKDRASDMANYALLFKGVSPSTEAGKAILREKTPVKTFAAAADLKQEIEDDASIKIAAPLMEMAMGLGNADRTPGGRQAARASARLTQLVGQQASSRCMQMLSTIQAQTPVLNVEAASIELIAAQVQQGLQIASHRDPVLHRIASEVHRYNHLGKGKLAAQRVVRTTLSAASLAPTIVGPVANTILFGELAGTGGTEQDKLLKEIYEDKRYNHRLSTLQELMHMAIFNYHLGILKGNGLLASCSKELLTCLVGPEQAEPLLALGVHRRVAVSSRDQ
jgi:hypothetical protein